MADVTNSSSLNLEPNPFEQSFASNTQQGHPTAAAATDATASASAQPGAIPRDPVKQIGQQFGSGAAGLDQKTPIPGIDKMLTPLPLAPGALQFGPAAPITSHLGAFGASSPAGWLAPRFGPITPGALNTPSMDSFGAQQAQGVQSPHGFPQMPAGVHVPQMSGTGSGGGADANGLPRAFAFGHTPQGVLPLESPGISSLVGMNAAGVSSQMPGMPVAANGTPVPPLSEGAQGPNGSGAGAKPPGENAAANGLYMLSQNQATDKTKDAAAPKDERERFSLSPETKRRGSKQPPKSELQPPQPAPPAGRASVDSSSSIDDAHAVGASSAGAVPRSRHNSVTKKRGSKELDEDSLKRDGAGAEDEHGEKRRWANSSQQGSDPENEEKRKQFLERNRIAAIKCRARKKQWVDNLQQKVDMYSRANDELMQKNEKMRVDFDALRQFVLRYHDIRSLPQHILHIVQGGDPSGEAPVAATAAGGHDFAGMPSHVLPGAMPGTMAGHAPMPPVSGAQSMASSIVPSPVPQRGAPSRQSDPRYAQHAPGHTYAPAHHAAPRQPPMQAPAMQHIHQTTQ